MLRTRRILSFSEKVLNFLLLVYFFFFLLYFTQLWWMVSGTFITLVSTVLNALMWIVIGFSGVLILIAFQLLITDRIFPFGPVLGIGLRIVFICICTLCIRIFSTIINQGFHINL
ncbi:MAG: hypothetical protein AB9828_09895 [Sphaerochaetaceae bacterium]